MARPRKELTREEVIKGREWLVPRGMEWIFVPVSVFSKTYYLIATRRDESEYYRASSNALEDVYDRIVKDNPGRISIELLANPVVATQNYCVVPCHLIVNDENGTPIVSDFQVGEVRVSMTSSDAEREMPFTTAFRRVRDKIIYADLLGLPGRFFEEDGTPVVFFEKGTPDGEPIEEEAEPPLNSAEEAEYEELCKVPAPYRKKTGETGTRPLGEIPESWIKLFSSEQNPDEELRKKVIRFAELKEKKESAEKNTQKESNPDE